MTAGIREADFWVRVAAVVATLLAVVAALFRDWFQARVFPPKLVLCQDPRGVRQRPEQSHLIIDGKQHPTPSRWYHVKVKNERRLTPATDTQVVLQEIGIPNAAGTYVWQSAGDIPLGVRHENLLRPGRIVGRPLEFDLCNVYQRSGAEAEKPPLFGLCVPVPVNDVPLQRTESFRMALSLLARSVEADSEPLKLEIVWNGQWSDETEQMANNLVIRRL